MQCRALKVCRSSFCTKMQLLQDYVFQNLKKSKKSIYSNVQVHLWCALFLRTSLFKYSNGTRSTCYQLECLPCKSWQAHLTYKLRSARLFVFSILHHCKLSLFYKVCKLCTWDASSQQPVYSLLNCAHAIVHVRWCFSRSRSLKYARGMTCTSLVHICTS